MTPTMMMMSNGGCWSFIMIFLVFSGSGGVNGADIMLQKNLTYCDTDLSVTISDASLSCDGSNLCSLGSYATVTANMYFSGLTSSSAYVNVKLHKSAITRNIITDREIDLCGHVRSNNGNCYNDGSYRFRTTEVLPSYGDKDWFLTGIEFPIELIITQKSSSSGGSTTIIGHCWSKVTPIVTHGADWAGSSYADPPSAGKVGFIVFMVVSVFVILTGLMCLWMNTWEVIEDHDNNNDENDFVMVGDGGDDPREKDRENDYL